MKKTRKSVVCLMIAMMFFVQIFAGTGFTSEAKSGTWKKKGNNYCYQYSDGTYAKSEWVVTNGKKFYVNASKVRQKGWKKLKGKYYYFGTNGVMRKGLQTINSKKYYLAKDGARRTGWQKIKNKWYYFNKSGVMLKNQKVGQYYVGKDGARITKKTTSGGTTAKPVGSRVWVSATGSKYHSSPSCSNMRSPIEMTKSDAESRGYTKCSKCY